MPPPAIPPEPEPPPQSYSTWEELLEVGRAAVAAAAANGTWIHSTTTGASGLTAERRSSLLSLLRLPGHFRRSSGRTAPCIGLYDTGASKTFMSTRMAVDLGLTLRPCPGLKVSNGDGSFQMAAGQVTTKLSIGPRWSAELTFVVIDLAKFDFILGLPDIIACRLELRTDPVRIVSRGASGSEGKGARNRSLELPLVISGHEAAREEDGLPPLHVHTLLSAADFRKSVQDDEVFAVLPDSEGTYLRHHTAPEVDETTLAWLDTLHTLRTDLDAEGHDGAALLHAAAEIDEDQARLQAMFPSTFAEDLPSRPSATWPGEEYARLKFKDGVLPQSVRQFRLPEGVRAALQQTIEDMLRHGLIEPHDGTGVSSPVLFAPKPGSTELRFCFDCRALNKAIADVHYPAPTTEELLDKVARLKQEAAAAGATGQLWYSKADARHGFFQVAVHPEDRKYLAFSVPVLDGSYRYTVLPMGLKSSSFEFQRRMDLILAPLANKTTFEYEVHRREMCQVDGADVERVVTRRGKAIGTACVYVDDLLCVSFGSREEHESLVHQTFARFAAHNVVFKISKTVLFRSEIDFLGHTLTQSGVRQQAGKVDAILNWPSPSSQADVRSFLGLASYYRKFVDGFARIAQPLSDLLRGDASSFPAELPPPAAAAFADLKRALTTAPVLVYYDATRDTQLWTDASAYAIGGVLLQRDSAGDWRPVSYYSRRLLDSESKYSTYARELLGVRDCLLAFRYYLVGTPVVVKTDHCSLRWFLQQKELSGLQARWLSVFESFNIREIEYIPGEKNVVADALSRHPDPDGERFEHLIPPANMPGPTHCHAFEDAALDESPTVSRQPASTVDGAADWQREGYNVSGRMPASASTYDSLYAACPDFAAPWSSRHHPHAMTETYPDFFTNTDGTLLFRRDLGGGSSAPDDVNDSQLGGSRLCVPTAARQELLVAAHDAATSGHLGARKSYARLVDAEVYWPSMLADVSAFVATCEACQRSKPYNRPAAGLPTPLEIPEGRWRVVSLDIVSGFPPSGKEGYDCIVVFSDRFSKQAYFCPSTMKGLSAEVVAELYVQHVFRVQGVPSVLLSDRDSKFTSVFWERLLELLGTKLVLSASYHHQTNGQVERINQTLANFLRAYCGKDGTEWHRRLPVYEFAYNSSTHHTTGVAPFQVVYGEVPPSPLQLVNPGKSRSKAATELADLLVNTRRAVHDALSESAQRYREMNATARRGTRFAKGDRILLSTRHLSLQGAERRKTFPKFVGPFTVARTRGDNNVELELDGRFRFIDPVVHVERVRPYRSRDLVEEPVFASDEIAQALATDPRGGTWWEVEDVVAHVGSKGRRRYLVRYKGFSATFDEWKRTCDVSEELVQDYEELLRRACPAGPAPAVEATVRAQAPGPTGVRRSTRVVGRSKR